MSTFAILATGPSLTQEIVDNVRGRCGVIAVSDAYRLAPWADALVSQDRAWWKHHPEALEFAGRRFIGVPPDQIRGVEQADRVGAITSGTNSGLLGCHVAVTVFHATRILLLGLDLQGTHFFGPHPPELKNTKPERFAVMRKQFQQWPHKGVEVINCTPSSSLMCFPFGDLAAILQLETAEVDNGTRDEDRGTRRGREDAVRLQAEVAASRRPIAPISD